MTPLRRSLVCALALAALPTTALVAGTVYVPLPGVPSLGAFTYETQVLVTNPTTQQRNTKHFSIAAGADGTVRSVQPTSLFIGAGQTAVLKPTAAFRGLLELTGSAELRYGARLQGTGSAAALGVLLPVIGSDNAVAANGTVVLQGLLMTTNRNSHVWLVNLGAKAAQCTLALTRADGVAIGVGATTAVPPLSLKLLANVLTGAANPAVGIKEVRATVGCNGSFYAFATLADAATGEMATVLPAARGDSLLVPPGAEAPCPAGAVCMTKAGVVHQATVANPVGRLTFPTPAMVAGRVRLSLDVTVGNFYPLDPDGKHLVYWFVLNKNFNMPGMLYFRGPLESVALVRHGVGLTHAEKPKIQTAFAAIPGHTYRCVNDYDMAARSYTVTITDTETGVVAARLDGVPNVTQMTLITTDRFIVDMGFKENVIPDEVPAYGWTWSNARLEIYPK